MESLRVKFAAKSVCGNRSKALTDSSITREKKSSKVIKKGAKWLRRPLLIIGHAAAYIFRKNLCSTCPMAAPCVTGSQVGAVSYCSKDCLRRSWEAIMSFWIWKNPPSQWHTALSKSTLLRVLAPWPWECN